VLGVPLAPRAVVGPARRRAGAWVRNILQELEYVT
jgi:hypothetical protein